MGIYMIIIIIIIIMKLNNNNVICALNGVNVTGWGMGSQETDGGVYK